MEPGKQGKPETISLIHSKIECVSCTEEGTFPAIIYNVSGDSVCLVTDHEFSPEDSVSIHASREAHEEDEKAARIDGSTGVVMWSKPVERRNRRLYLAGLSLPHTVGVERDGDACEICGTATSEEDSCRTEGFPWLCPECNEQISHLPDKLGEIADKYLVGNPL